MFPHFILRSAAQVRDELEAATWADILPDGAPLQLDEIIQTSLFRLKPTQSNAFSLSGAPGSFPLLSQGDHPSLGIPCWYFHPCETQTAVDEFMAEEPGSSLDRWLELWFMIVGSILTL